MLVISLLFSVTGILFSDTIAARLTPDPDLQNLCEQYLSVNLVYCWGIFLQTYGQRLLQAVGDTVLSMISLIIGAVLNIILDPIMIFGLLGCPAMGIRGAAIATVIGQLTGAAAALLFNRFKNPLIHVQFRHYHFSWQDVADIYRVGLPTIIMQAIGSIMTFAVNSILLHISTTTVAFFGIYYKLQNFLMMPINGLGQAAIPVVGYNYGAKEISRVQQTWKILLPTGISISAFRNSSVLDLSLPAASAIFCKFCHANSRNSCPENHLRILCSGIRHNSVRIFCFRPWKWRDQYGQCCYPTAGITCSLPMDSDSDCWYLLWLVCFLVCGDCGLHI